MDQLPPPPAWKKPIQAEDSLEGIHDRIAQRVDYYLTLDNVIIERIKEIGSYPPKRDMIKAIHKTTPIEERLQEAKWYAIDHNRDLVKQAIEKMTERGIQVTLARTRKML